MKLIEYFTQFLTDTVNLNQSRLNDLDTRVDRITAALKGVANLDGRVLDTVPQGSWAHRTIIRPADGLEFDADFLLHLAEDLDWNLDPRQYAKAVWDALSNHNTYGSMSARKDRCVRVTYANDCHIDVVPYVILGDGREVIINRATNAFEDTKPVGFTEWLQEKDDLTGGNLRKAIRLLKYLRDHRGAFRIKSVLLTTLVGNVVDSWRTVGADYYNDVPTTLVHLVEALDRWLWQYQGFKPSICDPSCPSTSFDHRWTDNQFFALRDRIHELAPNIRAAYDTAGVAASITAWQGVFGSSFPSTLTARAITAAAGPVINRTPRDRAPNEQFIEEMFPVNETHRVSIVCEVSEPNRAARRLRSRRGRVPKSRSLLFKIIDTNVPRPFQAYWKVRNRGLEAAALGQLRGEIHPDEGRYQRAEHTKYVGHHFVECYIVKNGICVARAHEPVIID